MSKTIYKVYQKTDLALNGELDRTEGRFFATKEAAIKWITRYLEGEKRRLAKVAKKESKEFQSYGGEGWVRCDFKIKSGKPGIHLTWVDKYENGDKVTGGSSWIHIDPIQLHS